MDPFPQTIIDIIASFLPKTDDESEAHVSYPLSKAATLNKAWQAAIEEINFRTIVVRSNGLNDFTAMVHSRRRRYLRKIKFQVILPSYCGTACTRFEREAERLANDECFTRAFRRLFTVLNGWDAERQDLKATITLELDNVFSVKDWGMISEAEKDHRVNTLGFDAEEYRYKYSQLCLTDDDRIPSVSCIWQFIVGKHCLRTIGLDVPVRIAGKLPNMREIQCWSMNDSLYGFPEVRLDRRLAFVRAAINDSAWRSRLRVAVFDFHEAKATKYRGIWYNIIPQGHAHDPFTLSLHILSLNLTHLKLSASIDSTFFWPTSESDSPIPTPTWPNLKLMDIEFAISTPSGRFFFQGKVDTQHPTFQSNLIMPPALALADVIPEDLPAHVPDHIHIAEGYRHTGAPVHFEKIRVNADVMDGFLYAFARAAREMPSILHIRLSTGRVLAWGDHCSRFEICFYAPGRRANYGDEGEDERARRRIYCEVGDYAMPRDVMELLRGVASERFPEYVVSRWLPDIYALSEEEKERQGDIS